MCILHKKTFMVYYTFYILSCGDQPTFFTKKCNGGSNNITLRNIMDIAQSRCTVIFICVYIISRVNRTMRLSQCRSSDNASCFNELSSSNIAIRQFSNYRRTITPIYF